MRREGGEEVSSPDGLPGWMDGRREGWRRCKQNSGEGRGREEGGEECVCRQQSGETRTVTQRRTPKSRQRRVTAQPASHGRM